jgi:DNA polymerase, archaea type
LTIDTPNPIELVAEGQKFRVYALPHLIKLRNIGMKLEPTKAYGAAFNHAGLITEEQFAKSPLCEGSIPRYLYLHPEFWSNEQLEQHNWRFEGVRTVPGKTFTYDDNGTVTGGPYRLFILDIDSEAAYLRCKKLLEEDWLKHTYVTKTRKVTKTGEQYGYHIYWLEDWKEDDDVIGISHDDCKSNGFFEIMVGIDYTQVLGHHRDDSKFTYQQVGCQELKDLTIMIANGLYNRLLNEVLKELLHDPENIKKRRKIQQKSKDPLHRNCGVGSKEAERERQRKIPNSFSKTLPDGLITAISFWAERFYLPGERFHFMLTFLGTIARYGIDNSSVEKITDKIFYDTKDSKSENRIKWHGIYKDACQKLLEKAEVKGIPALVNWIRHNPKFTEEEATKEVEDLISLLECAERTEREKEATPKETKEKYDSTSTGVHDSTFLSKVPNQNPLGYAMHIIEKTVKRDTALVKLTTYTCLSAYTNNPINLAIIASTAEGKTYPVEQTISKFPDADVQRIGTMSPKVLIRQDGILVDENNDSIQDQVDQLKKELETEEDKNKLSLLKQKLSDLTKNARCLIDLRNKVYVFFEPPDRSMWDILKPILSHDTEYMTHNYVYDIPGTGHPVKKIVTRGWPALIFCSAGSKNESYWEEWPEIASRCFVISPNMIPEKYHESNFLIAQKKGLPKLIQQKLIVSDKEIELAKKCISYIKSQIIDRTVSTYAPYVQILGNILPSDKGTDVRTFDRMSSLFKTIPLFDSHFRPKLIFQEPATDADGNQITLTETCVIATLSDLGEVLKLVLDTSSIPQWKMKIFREIFCDKYKETEQDLTIPDIANHYHKLRGKKISRETIKKQLIPEWLNCSLIDEKIEENLNSNRPIKKYCPLVDVSDAEHPVIRSPKLLENWLESEILGLCYDGKDGSFNQARVKFQDTDGKFMQNHEFVAKYNGYQKLSHFLTFGDKNPRCYKHIIDLEILGEHDRLLETLIDSEPPSNSPGKEGGIIVSSGALTLNEPYLPNGAISEPIQKTPLKTSNQKNICENKNENKVLETHFQIDNNSDVLDQKEQDLTESSSTYYYSSPISQTKAKAGSFPGSVNHLTTKQSSTKKIDNLDLDPNPYRPRFCKANTVLKGWSSLDSYKRRPINLEFESKSKGKSLSAIAIKILSIERRKTKSEVKLELKKILKTLVKKVDPPKPDVLNQVSQEPILEPHQADQLEELVPQSQQVVLEPPIESIKLELVKTDQHQNQRLILKPPQLEPVIKIKSNRPEVINSVHLDFEWVPYKGKYEHHKTHIYEASFCTNQGERTTLHISNYPDQEKGLLEDILFHLKQFPLTFGWYSSSVVVYDKETGQSDGIDSDLFLLHQRCSYHNLTSPIEVRERYTRFKDPKKKHIDLGKVFEKEIVQDNFFNGRYRTSSLEHVSEALLGIGKYGNLAGRNILSLPIEEQMKYVTRDSELGMSLAQYNNCLILRMMKVFAGYSNMDYYYTCHSRSGGWYANRYQKMLDSGECSIEFTPNYTLTKVPTGGGRHIPSAKGYFVGIKVYELDIKGMYPRIAINNNLSFDTLNCTCCGGKEAAYINQETIDEINEYHIEKKIPRERVGRRWTCRNRIGAYPKVLLEISADRDKYLKLKEEELAKPKPDSNLVEEYQIGQIGAKLYSNAGFGLFGNEHFKFSNYKVFECITAEGRRIQRQMESIAKTKGFDVIYGFTDAIFVKDKDKDLVGLKEEKVHKYIQLINNQFNVTVELKTTFVNSIFYGLDNRFVGWTGNEKDKVVVKGLEGVVSDLMPIWVQRWCERIVTELVKHPETRFEVIPRLIEEAFDELTKINHKDLRYTQRVRKHRHEYKNGGARVVKLTEILGKDKGEVVYWYETYKEEYVKSKKCWKRKDSYSIYPEKLNLDKYKTFLIDKLEDTLVITGFDVKKLRQELLKSTEIEDRNQYKAK